MLVQATTPEQSHQAGEWVSVGSVKYLRLRRTFKPVLKAFVIIIVLFCFEGFRYYYSVCTSSRLFDLAGGRSGLAWALASLGVVPDKPWLSQFLAAAFSDGLASDQVRCASLLFCLASLDFDYLVEWLGDFLEGKYSEDEAGDGTGLDLSLQKYAALVGVLGALAEMDSRQLRAAWLDQSLSPEW